MYFICEKKKEWVGGHRNFSKLRASTYLKEFGHDRFL